MAHQGRSPGIDNAVGEPISRSVEFCFRDTADFGRYVDGDGTKGRYGRYHNSSWSQVESRIAELEACDGCVLFPTGMAAMTAIALAFLQTGDTIAYCQNSYRNIGTLFGTVLPPLGIRSVALDHAHDQQFEHQLREIARDPSLRAVFIEAPSNPHLYLVDFEAVRDLLGDRLLVVDASFAGPQQLRPCQLGADLTVRSCTKYLGGHGDLMAGSAAGSSGHVARLRKVRDVTGSVPDGSVAYLLNRSLDTLAIRMRHYQDVATAVASYLEAQPWVRRVFYTGLESHPHARLIARYLGGHGGVITFEVNAGKAAASAFVDALGVPYMASNFGSTRTLVEQLSVFTYYALTAADRESLGITDSLIRLSVGMETAELLIADLDQAARRTLAEVELMERRPTSAW
jgi:cystathionine gamma-synthase